MDIKSILDNGYELSPYYSINKIKNYDDYDTLDLDEDTIRLIIVSTSEQRMNLLYNDDKLLFVKYLTRYHIKPLDIVEKLNKELNAKDGPDYDEIKLWLHVMELDDIKGPIFVPCFDNDYYKNSNDLIDDYLFDKDEHIVSFVIYLLKNHLSEKDIVKDLNRYVNFINEVLSLRNTKEEKRKYTNETLSIIIDSLSYSTSLDKVFTDKITKFYTTNLLYLANAGDKCSMRTLGYEYYEGTNGFECDANKASYWLEKYYSVTEDPDIARTLGYIYYYGRTTNGIPQKDKAFQYFSIGHHAGKYYEATYKLADCYVKGYGTPINHQCAFNLVASIYATTLEHFLNGDDSKFADVALRLGSYFKDGIYVDKDLEEAQSLYLEAKVAIKKRLENMEYIGDRSVAAGISKTLDELNKEIGIQERIIKNGGYIIKNPKIRYTNKKFKINIKGEYIHIVIKQKPQSDTKYLLNEASTINFIERSEKIEYYVKPSLMDSIEDFVNAINEYKIKQISFEGNKIYIVLDMHVHDSFPAFTECDEIIFIPQTIKDIKKQYPIVSVEFYEGSKQYDYLSLKDDVKIGDQVTIKSNNEYKTGLVKNVKMLYEDELPLPIEKIGKAI